MIEIYGPDKVGSYQSEDFKDLVEKINKEISESDSNTVTYCMSEENGNKYSAKLKKLYERAGWDEVDFEYNYDWDYQSAEMTLRKYEN